MLSVLREAEGLIPEGTVLMQIGEAGGIDLVVDLLSREAVRVKPGDPVEVSQWGGEGLLTGRVTRIEPLGRLKVSALGIEEQRVNVIISLDAASTARAARLGHGYQLDASIILWQADDVLRVPIGALFRGPDGGWQLFALDKGRARLRSVRIGHIGDAQAEVLAGLSEGERVVLNPTTLLGDGKKAKPR